MKKFAIVLMMALLVLGCVFAATTSKDANNGDKFVVKTTINTIYPVYQIVGSNNNSESVTSAHASGTVPEIEGIVDEDNQTLTIKVSLQHFGMKDNDMDTNTKVSIRYSNNVDVTITGSELKNTSSNETGHVQSSSLPSVRFNVIPSTTETKLELVKKSVSNNVATITAKYSGLVNTKDKAVEIASGSFTWDISTLTSGDTYKADVVVKYTVV